MAPEELLQYYRLLDAAYGTLEISERIRSELVALRRDQLNLRKKSVWGRLLVLLITLISGVPVLLTILPKSVLAPKGVWVTLFVGLILAYAVMALYNWTKDRAEEKEISSRIETMPYRRPEDDPIFLEMQLTTFATRFSLAGEILACDPPDSMKADFENLANYWKMRIEREASRMEGMHKFGTISEERYQRMRSWIAQVLPSG